VHHKFYYRAVVCENCVYCDVSCQDFIDCFEESTSFDELKVLRGIVYDGLLTAEQQVMFLVAVIYDKCYRCFNIAGG